MSFLRFSFALLSTVGVVAQAQRDLTFHVGAGCAFSNYTTLAAVHASDAASPPTHGAVLSYRLQLEMGLGSGVYVLHFTQFNLPDDDLVRLEGEGGSVILSGSNTTGAFYATPIVGDGVTIELWKTKGASTSSSASCLGFEIDGLRFAPQKAAEVAQEKDLAVGLPSVLESATVETKSNSSNAAKNDESICGTDESVEAVCLEIAGTAEDLVMYQKARSVARLTIRKDNSMVAFCTGWLLGCEGHLITNQHCIGNWMDALNTGVEFFAEAQTCSAGSNSGSEGTCRTQGSCPGRIAVSSTVLVAVSKELDYALVKLTPDDGSDVSSLLQSVGGYLQLRSTGPKLEETIFIPQHPLGGAKRVAWTVNGKPGRIESLTTDTCGSTDAGYSVDTQDGASGSPVISMTDDTVVALHHCGGCPNGGIPSDKLIADFQSKGVLPKCAVAS